MHEISDAELKLFDEMFPIATKVTPSDTCDHNWIETESGVTCDKCGVLNVDKQLYIERTEVIKVRNYHIYNRKSYFIEKLRLLTGRKQSQSPVYNEMIVILKTKNIKTLIQLRRTMRRCGYSKFYKYIYSIYFDVTGKKEIDLTYSDIIKLSSKFLDVERRFKQVLIGRSNFPSYNLTIYLLLKQEGYSCYSNILLPKNERRLSKIFEKLLNY